MNFIDFTGKTVVVTGAARGIPQAIALKFAEYGANVWSGDIAPSEETVETCKAMGVRAGYVITDVSSYEQMKVLRDTVIEKEGKIDVWVNGAGILDSHTLSDISEKDLRRIMNINAMGPIFGTQLAMQHMIPRKSGVIINLASIAGKLSNATGLVPYDISKQAVVTLTHGAAVECAPHGVRVNGVCPGFVRTKIWDKLFGEKNTEDEHWEGVTKRNCPMGRLQDEEDMANAAVFLASDAAKNITGQTLNVDGGKVPD